MKNIKDIVIGIFAVIGFATIVTGFTNETSDPQYPESHVWEMYRIPSDGITYTLNKKTGEDYKPASWKSPAKHVRYDLRIIREREECLSRADWAGGYLYMR